MAEKRISNTGYYRQFGGLHYPPCYYDDPESEFADTFTGNIEKEKNEFEQWEKQMSQSLQ